LSKLETALCCIEPNIKNHIFISLIERVSDEMEEGIVTVAEQLIAKGMNEERIIIAKRLLSEKLDDLFIAKITELSLEQIQKLKDKSY
jgi:hypothetical protein